MANDTCPKMQKLVTQIAAKYGIDLETAEPGEVYIKLELRGFMPLVIEKPWHDEVAVGHTFLREGDVMYDPKVVFVITPFGWKVREYTMHPLGLYRRYGEKVGGNIQYKLSELPGVGNLIDFVEGMWYPNLRDQGYLEHGVRKELE